MGFEETKLQCIRMYLTVLLQVLLVLVALLAGLLAPVCTCTFNMQVPYCRYSLSTHVNKSQISQEMPVLLINQHLDRENQTPPIKKEHQWERKKRTPNPPQTPQIKPIQISLQSCRKQNKKHHNPSPHMHHTSAPQSIPK